jgi:hypothetical protein
LGSHVAPGGDLPLRYLLTAALPTSVKFYLFIQPVFQSGVLGSIPDGGRLHSHAQVVGNLLGEAGRNEQVLVEGR